MDEHLSNPQMPDSETEALPFKQPPVLTLDEPFLRRGVDPSKAKLDAQWEHPEEMRSRLKREEAEQQTRLQKEMLTQQQQHQLAIYRFLVKEAAVYVSGLILIGILCVTSTQILANKTASAEERSWARTTLAAVATAIAGYIFGRNSQSSTNR
jgi:hypothetical protein